MSGKGSVNYKLQKVVWVLTNKLDWLLMIITDSDSGSLHIVWHQAVFYFVYGGAFKLPGWTGN